MRLAISLGLLCCASTALAQQATTTGPDGDAADAPPAADAAETAPAGAAAAQPEPPPATTAPATTAPATTAPASELAPATPAEPSPEAQARYREIVTAAVAEFDAGRWAEARALFLRAHELWPSARTYRTLGMTSFELRNYPLALRELQQALDDPRRPLDDALRAQVQALLGRTYAYVGRYRVVLSPADAQLLVDGVPTALPAGEKLLLGVGAHELIARAPEHRELRRRIVVQGREDAALSFALSPRQHEPSAPVAATPAPAAPVAAPAPAPPAADAGREGATGGSRLWTWVAAGSAVALGAASTGLWLASNSEYEDLEDECADRPAADPCREGQLDTSGVTDLETGHHITLALAGAAGVAAVVLFFVEGQGDVVAERAPPAVSITPLGASVRGRF